MLCQRVWKREADQIVEKEGCAVVVWHGKELGFEVLRWREKEKEKEEAFLIRKLYSNN